MLDIIKGVFFDIGYTLCEPATGDWMFTHKFFDNIKIGSLKNLPKDRIIMARQKSSKYLNDNHFLKTLDEEYEQNIIAYSIIAEEIPELNISNEKVREIAYDRTYNMSNYRFYYDVKQSIEIQPILITTKVENWDGIMISKISDLINILKY